MKNVPLEYIYANELKKVFSVFGHFYDVKIDTKRDPFQFRSVLEIFRKIPDSNSCEIASACPDAVFEHNKGQTTIIFW